ncbi:hypothetical protein BofuT4_P048770.1 [Botrytis cinerea T4]|uniref:Uncharacterized protein n=1 Tax=Botryotinia fuckeliana (strain T4) TaxID=999810 RepID=G2XZH2_BOTF4|nr:hypothetical protein BofuT4_P048770.1 [Botrytis cinerea T4]
MYTKTVSTLKFVGSISLGLLTGVSYTLSSLTIPAFLTLPSATLASRSYSSLTTLATTHTRALTWISSWSKTHCTEETIKEAYEPQTNGCKLRGFEQERERL